jgi:hypothetical protein
VLSQGIGKTGISKTRSKSKSTNIAIAELSTTCSEDLFAFLTQKSSKVVINVQSSHPKTQESSQMVHHAPGTSVFLAFPQI